MPPSMTSISSIPHVPHRPDVRKTQDKAAQANDSGPSGRPHHPVYSRPGWTQNLRAKFMQKLRTLNPAPSRVEVTQDAKLKKKRTCLHTGMACDDTHQQEHHARHAGAARARLRKKLPGGTSSASARTASAHGSTSRPPTSLSHPASADEVKANIGASLMAMLELSDRNHDKTPTSDDLKLARKLIAALLDDALYAQQLVIHNEIWRQSDSAALRTLNEYATAALDIAFRHAWDMASNVTKASRAPLPMPPHARLLPDDKARQSFKQNLGSLNSLLRNGSSSLTEQELARILDAAAKVGELNEAMKRQLDLNLSQEAVPAHLFHAPYRSIEIFERELNRLVNEAIDKTVPAPATNRGTAQAAA